MKKRIGTLSILWLKCCWSHSLHELGIDTGTLVLRISINRKTQGCRFGFGYRTETDARFGLKWASTWVITLWPKAYGNLLEVLTGQGCTECRVMGLAVPHLAACDECCPNGMGPCQIWPFYHMILLKQMLENLCTSPTDVNDASVNAGLFCWGESCNRKSKSLGHQYGQDVSLQSGSRWPRQNMCRGFSCKS